MSRQTASPRLGGDCWSRNQMAARLWDLIGWRVVHRAPPGFCNQLDWICFLEQSVNPPIALEAAWLLATPPVGFEPTTGCLEGGGITGANPSAQLERVGRRAQGCAQGWCNSLQSLRTGLTPCNRLPCRQAVDHQRTDPQPPATSCLALRWAASISAGSPPALAG